MLLPVQQFPASKEQTQALQAMLSAFAETLLADPAQHHEVLLQTWKLNEQSGSGVLGQHMKAWAPEIGLGIWPDRKPPHGWTEDGFMDAVAAKFRSAEPEMPTCRLLRLAGTPAARLDASQKMRGFGTTIDLFGRQEYPQLEQRARKLYLPRIKEARFHHEPFYLPLLDRQSLQAAATPARLSEWLCGVDVYVRESPEDGGILIVSRLPLLPIVEAMQRKMQANASR